MARGIYQFPTFVLLFLMETLKTIPLHGEKDSKAQKSRYIINKTRKIKKQETKRAKGRETKQWSSHHLEPSGRISDTQRLFHKGLWDERRKELGSFCSSEPTGWAHGECKDSNAHMG